MACSNPYLLQTLVQDYIQNENIALADVLCERNQEIAALQRQVSLLEEENNHLHNQYHILEDHYGNQTIFRWNPETGIYEETGYIMNDERVENIARRLNFERESDDDESVETNEMFELEI